MNTTNSKVEVRFNVRTADWLEKEVKQRLEEEYAHHMTKGGELVLTSQSAREQAANQKEVLARL